MTLKLKEQNPIPRRLSHYTTMAGFYGIIDDGCLWASNASFLNDRRELVHGLEGARKALKEILSKRGYEDWSDCLEEVVTEMEGGKIPDTYVACFCRNSDLLSQWRGYGGGVQGISVTFNVTKMRSRFKAHRGWLYSVIYSDFSTKQKMKNELVAQLNDLAGMDNIPELSNDQKKSELFRRISRLLPRFKHIGFSGEREWRFVVQTEIPTEDIKFRVGGGSVLVPYMKLGEHSGLLPIERICIGPGRDQALTAKSVELFLKAKGYEGVKVMLSRIPYRL